MEEDASYRRRLEADKSASVGQLLFKAARLWNEEALHRVRRRSGTVTLRASHTSLLPHLDLEGTRLTTLAARLGVSKQAAGELVGELEEMGLVERVADPSDGRAKLIRFTRKGRAGLLDGLAVLREIEGELASAIGRRRMAALAETLALLVGALGARPLSDPGSGEGGANR